MKVIFSSASLTTIGGITVGTPFFADRKSEKGRGLYMKIDKNSGLMKNQFSSNVYAVNLETGQLREFPYTAGVEVAEAKIVCE